MNEAMYRARLLEMQHDELAYAIAMYDQYIIDHEDTIEQGGWVPVCFMEFLDCEMMELWGGFNDWMNR